MDTQLKRVLVVDDEPRYVWAVRANLEACGYEVLTAIDGSSAIDVAVEEDLDLILLDLRMPDQDGFETCKQIRAFSSVPIILLAPLSESNVRLKSLECGADDYLPKPFVVAELLERVRAALHCSSTGEKVRLGARYQSGDLVVEYSVQRVYAQGHEIDLTSSEFLLLCELIRQPGRVLVPEYLLSQVWGNGYSADTRLLWQAIHRLRHKIERNPKKPQHILTRSGLGYMFVEQ